VLAVQHAGSTITAAGAVVALGAASLALGLVEVSARSASNPATPASPLHNGWVVAGLVIVLLGAVVAIGNVAYLFFSQLAKERW
jgi:hypothetical protein